MNSLGFYPRAWSRFIKPLGSVAAFLVIALPARWVLADEPARPADTGSADAGAGATDPLVAAQAATDDVRYEDALDLVSPVRTDARPRRRFRALEIAAIAE